MNPVHALLPLAVAYGTSLVWVWERWWSTGSYYGHGPLLVLVLVWALWSGRPRWGTLPAHPDLRGWWLLGPALFLHLAGAALMIDSLSAASMVLALPGAVLLSSGPARLRAQLPALALVVFAVPLPMYVIDRLTFVLKEMAIGAGLGLANGLGLGAHREGAELFVPGQEQALIVADPCGGLRSLLALLALGYCLAFLFGPQAGARRWVVLALAGPVAIVANIVRIAVLCWLASWQGVPFASGTGHDLVNAVVWVADLGILVALDFWVVRRWVPGGRP